MTAEHVPCDVEQGGCRCFRAAGHKGGHICPSGHMWNVGRAGGQPVTVTVQAPAPCLCDCCGLPPLLTAGCGHSFCEVCVGRGHDRSCPRCELSEPAAGVLKEDETEKW